MMGNVNMLLSHHRRETELNIPWQVRRSLIPKRDWFAVYKPVICALNVLTICM